MEIKLVMPCFEYWESYKEFYSQMDHEGCVKGMDWDGISRPEVYFQEAQDMREGRNLEGLVPCTNFWIIANDEYVGRMSIRHELNDHLREYGGHIGYEVRPKARRKGIASRALKLALDYCRSELKLCEVMLTCDDGNVASIKTIERNKGKLLEVKKTSSRVSRYYKISLS